MGLASLPLSTVRLPGVGGRCKVEPEDFVVEELPEEAPAKAGEHLRLWVEKRDIDHMAFLERIAEALGVPTSDLGYAGMKDRRAVTRQWLSAPRGCAARLSQIDGNGVRFLEVAYGPDKLRTGALRGNRFEVLLRDVHADAEARAQAILNDLGALGLANFYGSQRFGHAGNNVADGRRALAELTDTGRASLSGRRLRLVLSAVQAHLYNEVLSRRLGDGLLHTLLVGDVALEKRTGLWRWVEERGLDAAQQTYRQHQLIPTGPMFGPKMRQTRGLVLERERAVLREAGLELRHFSQSKLTTGTRRELVVFPSEISVATDPNGLRLRFVLPAGSYATVLLGEVMKVDSEDVPAELE